MRDAPLSILAFFAHPDDEIGIGSTLSYYTGSGVLANLICASRGEAATIFCEDCATRENLAEVRTRELACSCRHLGIAELRWLDWPDGGIKDLPRRRAIAQVVTIIRHMRPDIILTHPANGGYPHPDHLAVWEIARAAFDAAGDAGHFPEAGAPWAPARLFTRAIPQSMFDAAPAFAAYRVQLNGTQLPFYATPDEAIDVTMQVACCVERRQAAWECHRSQHNPEGTFTRMPDDVRQAYWENEHFVLAAVRVPLPPGERSDLLAGLDALPSEQAPSMQAGPIPNEAGEGALGGDQAGPPGPRAATALPQEGEFDLKPAAELRSNLAVRRAYLEIIQEYERLSNETHFESFLAPLADREREIIYVLARALRRAGGAPGDMDADPRVLLQARACSSLYARSQFLLVSAQHAVARYQELSGQAADPDQRAVWEEVLAMARERLAAVRDFAQGI